MLLRPQWLAGAVASSTTWGTSLARASLEQSGAAAICNKLSCDCYRQRHLPASKSASRRELVFREFTHDGRRGNRAHRRQKGTSSFSQTPSAHLVPLACTYHSLRFEHVSLGSDVYRAPAPPPMGTAWTARQSSELGQHDMLNPVRPATPDCAAPCPKEASPRPWSPVRLRNRGSSAMHRNINTWPNAL